MKLLKHLFIFILTFGIVFSFTAEIAKAEDMMNNLIPQDKEKTQEGKVKLDYNKYPLIRYGMDVHIENEVSDLLPWGWDDAAAKQGYQGLSIVASGLWKFNAIAASTVSTVVGEAFEVNMIKEFSDDIGKAVKKLAGYSETGFAEKGLWPYLSLIMICLTGIWAAYYGIIKRATSVALGGLLSTMVIVVIAIGFFTNTDKILNKINTGTSEVQNDVLSLSMSATQPGELTEKEGIATIRNQMFNIMVKYPWLLLEFGTTDQQKIEKEWKEKKQKGSRINAILKTGVYSEGRMKAVEYEVKELKNSNMKMESLTDRIVIITLVIISNSLLGTVLLLISGSMILYQILILIFAFATPFALLMGLFPTFQKTATNILFKLGHAFLMKIGLTLLATIYFVISSLVYTTKSANEGLILMFIMQIICAAALWFFRKEIIGVIASAKGTSTRDYKRMYSKSRKYVNKVTKPLTSKPGKPLAERTGYNKLKVKPGVGVVDPINHPIYNQKKKSPTNQPVEKREVKQQAPASKTSQPAQKDQKSQQEPATRNAPAKQPVAKDQQLADRTKQAAPAATSKAPEQSKTAANAKDTVQLKANKSVKNTLAERNVSAASNKVVIKDWRENNNAEKKPVQNVDRSVKNETKSEQ